MSAPAIKRNSAADGEPAATPLDDLLDNLLAAGKMLNKERDGGRLGAIEALNAVWEFLNSIPGTVDHRRPIVALLNALASLEDGVTLPILNPKAGGPGRRRASAALTVLKPQWWQRQNASRALAGVGTKPSAALPKPATGQTLHQVEEETPRSQPKP